MSTLEMAINKSSNMTPLHEKLCLKMLYYEIGSTRISYWDACLLVSPLFFSVFLLFNCKKFYSRLKSSSTPIISTFLIMVCVVNTAVMLRAIISMFLNDEQYMNEVLDRVLWLIMRFLLLTNEMSVIVFGLASAHLDSRSSIRLVLAVTSCIALSYSMIQFILELVFPDQTFHVTTLNYSLYGHGGVLFIAISSSILQLVYFVIVILPCIPSIQQRVPLPNKTSFYIYCSCLSILYLVQSIGSYLLYFRVHEGLCVLNFTVFIYFSFFNPFVYFTFISGYFSPTRGHLAFLYRSYYHLDPEFYNNSPRGIINSDDVVRRLDSSLVINENHLQNSTHFNGNPGQLHIDINHYPDDLTDSCQITVDPSCDYFSGQSHGKVSSRKSSEDQKGAGHGGLLAQPDTMPSYLPAMSPMPMKFNPSLWNSTRVANERPNQSSSSINCDTNVSNNLQHSNDKSH